MESAKDVFGNIGRTTFISNRRIEYRRASLGKKRIIPHTLNPDPNLRVPTNISSKWQEARPPL